MLKLAKRKTLHIWIAIMAVLFSALAPSVSHALAAKSGNLVQLCTVDGYKTVNLSTGEVEKSPASSRMSMEHCAFCVTHDGTFALLPPSGLSFAVVGGHDLYPSLFYHAPQPLASWSTANPRAPPSLI